MAPVASGSVLVVDDEESVLTTLHAILLQAGFEAVVTTTCSEALDHLRRQSFDVVLSDMRLADGDGLTIVDEARRRSPSTATILLTGYGSLESAIGALRRGATDYLQKPCDVQELQQTVRRAVEQHQDLVRLEQRRADVGAANAGLVAMNADLQRRANSLLAEADARSRMLRAVAEAGRVLARAVGDAASLLQRAARIVVPALTDGCAIYDGADGRQLKLVAFADVDPQRETLFLNARQPPGLSADGELAYVLRSCEPVLLENIDTAFLAVRQRSGMPSDPVLALRPRSALFVPLITRRKVRGVLALANQTADRRFGLDELAIAELLAVRAALALDP